MIDTSEKDLETTIEQSLINSGYQSCKSKEYNKDFCLIPQDVLAFIQKTQPEEWEKFESQHGEDAATKLFQRLAKVIDQQTSLEIFRKGISANSCHFKLAYFPPVNKLNPETEQLYGANIFTVVRQLRYSKQDTNNSIDLVLFLNGLPVFTGELKNPLKGQDVEDAIKQYQKRNYQEPIFRFGRCLSHFAIDPNEVFMTTHLRGTQTSFLPFNQGRGAKAGNPIVNNGFSTAYLWEKIWQPDSLLDLIENYIAREERKLVFPRYHQLDTVRALLADAREKGSGQSYLIQHSAGSGKSNSIAWLAYGLSRLHDWEDNRVFNSIIVISDRRVLDRQLQNTISQFEQTPGVVQNIDKTSQQLQEALEWGKDIIVTTLQKFPVILAKITIQPSPKKFAIIIDEAHSSQTGESRQKMQQVLSYANLETAAKAESHGEEEDLQERIVAAAKCRGKMPNLSYFAFTATPKATTLELFGTKQSDGSYAPFKLYSMTQAMEEGFILNVLQCYITYQSYFQLAKTIEEDPNYDSSAATSWLQNYVELQPQAIEKKIEIIGKHFHLHVAKQLKGKAKAMIVTPSRLHAVRYKLELDRYLRQNNRSYQSLVAFTGTVKDGGRDFTETGMNNTAAGIKIRDLEATFKQDSYRFLIVANKFQTGFNEPLLTAMYVDKKLAGVTAVQTLSRLNRTYKGKKTVVLDFANQPGEIKAAFQPYCHGIILKEGSDLNLPYDIQAELDSYRFYSTAEVDEFSQIFYNPKSTQDQLYPILNQVKYRYQEAAEETRLLFRRKLKEFIDSYSFIAPLLQRPDFRLERYYLFCCHLFNLLPREKQDNFPLELQNNIELESYRIQPTSEGRIQVSAETRELPAAITEKQGNLPSDNLAPLSEIIAAINRRFGTNFGEEERMLVEDLSTKLQQDKNLSNSLKVNRPENVKLIFAEKLAEMMEEVIETNLNFYKQFNDNEEFKELLLRLLFEQFMNMSTRKII